MYHISKKNAVKLRIKFWIEQLCTYDLIYMRRCDAFLAPNKNVFMRMDSLLPFYSIHPSIVLIVDMHIFQQGHQFVQLPVEDSGCNIMSVTRILSSEQILLNLHPIRIAYEINKKIWQPKLMEIGCGILVSFMHVPR